MARRVLECGIAVLLAVQAARIVWAAISPLGPLGSPAPAVAAPVGVDLAVLARFDPFHRGAPDVLGAAPPEAANGLRLYGVRANGASGSAIIAAADGKQAAFALGDTVSPGVTLQAVASDHVVLASGGRRTSLFFPRPTPAAAAGPYAPPPSASPVQAAPAAASLPPFLQPRVEDGRVNGLSVLPGAPGGEMMRDAGIQPGDVLLSVNGTSLSTPEKAAELGSQLAHADGAVVQYERGGQVRSATLKMARP